MKEYIFFTIILILLFQFISVRSQFTKYIPPPNNSNYTNCTLRDGTTVKSYCPNNLQCINTVLAANVWYQGMTIQNTILSEITSPGCCPVNTSGCFSKFMPFSAPGCCPDGTSCCFSKFNPNRFIGCVQKTTQCCGDTICPVGYSCCYQDNVANYYCCPGDNACSPVLGNSTGVNFTIYQRIPNNYFQGSNPLLQMRPHSQCLNVYVDDTINQTVIEPWPTNMTIPCGQFGGICLNETEDCISSNGINLSLNPNNTNTEFQKFGNICCKKNTTICPMSEKKNQKSIIGCADESIGESCCASQICPPQSKCCHILPPPDFITTDPYLGEWQTSTLFESILLNTSLITPRNPLNETARILPSSDICCPIGTYCCAILINLDKSLDVNRRRIFSFCGRNPYCTSISTVSETFQPVPSLSGFLPDYIENSDTIINNTQWQNPTVRFTTDPNYSSSNICNNCNYYNPPSYCSSPSNPSCSSSCEDQCGLDITAQPNPSCINNIS